MYLNEIKLIGFVGQDAETQEFTAFRERCFISSMLFLRASSTFWWFETRTIAAALMARA